FEAVVQRGRTHVVEGIDEKDPTTRLQAGRDQVPEGDEALRRNVGEPEAEKHDVVGAVRLPGKNVTQSVANLWIGDLQSIHRQHLWRCVDNGDTGGVGGRSEEHTSELQSRFDLVCRLLLEKKKKNQDWR